ncbi:leucine-rich repeat protein [Eubacterium sp. Marseille-QA0814]|uniref:leucine-rich repeat protein n=1 Tax=Eubacterium sp. Marseille-QA0814 TaxID=3378778 RepID=UPI003D0D42A5
MRLDAGGSDWKENEPRIQINGGTFEKKVMLNGSGDGTKPLTVINNGIFLDYVQAWVAASFENSFTTPEVVINGGEFHKKFWMRPTFVDKNDKDLTGYHVAVKLNGGTIHETLSVDKQPSDYGYAPVRPRLSYSDVTFLATEMLGKNAVQTGKGTFAAQDTSSYREYIPYYDYNKSKRWSEGFVFEIKAVNDQPTKILSNAWGMKSVTLDGNPIDYFKDWKGAFERMDNSTAHTLKFEWYPLAQELKDAGYSYRAECDRYISGSSAVQQTDTIAADKTSHTVTIPAGSDPKVYSYDLQLNLDKDGSFVGIFVNQHIVKLVVNEAPVVEPDPTIEGSVYYTSGIVFGRSISTAASVTPAEATKSCQWQRSTNGGSTWTNIDGATRGSYTPVAADMGENVRIRVVVTAEGYLGEIVGAPVKVSKAANNNYPEVIKLEAVKNGAGNYTGFKITNFDSDCEYVYSTTDTPNWSANQISSATVTGLTSDTTYYVFARFKETNTHTAGSIVSKNSIRLYDYVPLDRVLLEGYGSYGTIYIKKGESVELKVNVDPSNANSWKEITFKDEGATTSNIAISNGKINASTGTATPFHNGHTITITGVSKGSANLRASYPSATSSAYGTWYVVVYDDSTVANALRLESVYAYEDITLSENDTAELPTELPKLLPENSGYHLEWRIVKVGPYGASYKTSDDNITLENGKIKPKAAHTGSASTRLELVAVKEGVTNVKSFSQTSRINVTVTEAPTVELTGVTVAPTKVNLELNATYQLSAVKEPVNAAGSLNWESNNTGVATVDSTGKVTAKAQGTAIITVSCGNKKATCTVTVDHQHDYSGQPYLYLDPGNHCQECKAGDGYNIQAHEFTAWTDNGNGIHSRHCTVCKMTDGSTYTETAEHTWVWVVDQEAALNQPGKQHEECTGCHAKRNENTEIPALRDYAVTVTGGTATVATGTTITRAKEGVEVTVTADAPETGKVFDKWVVKAGGVTLANETSATTTFTMPGNDVKIEATYKDAPPSHSVYVGMTYTAGNFIYQITSIDTATLGQSKVIGVVAAKKNKITKVTIPDRADCKGYRLNVTAVGDKAFKSMKKLKKVTIGNKVTVIGKNAFKKCSKLKTVVIGKAVKTISSKAFIGDNKIKKITFKCKKLKTVNKNAFSKKAKKNIKSKKTKLKGNKKAIKLFKKKLKIK